MGGEEMKTVCLCNTSKRFCCRGKWRSEKGTRRKKQGQETVLRKDAVEWQILGIKWEKRGPLYNRSKKGADDT